MKIFLKLMASIIFLVALCLHLFCSNISIDAISIILLCLIFVPWIIDKIQSMKIPGVGEVVFAVKEEDKKDVQERLDDIDLQDEQLQEVESKYVFYNVRNQDIRLSLAGLRIEIESKLQEIAKKNQLDLWKNNSVTRLERELYKRELIDGNESAIIRDMIYILNSAVHNKLDKYDANSVNWIFDAGIKLIASLEKKAGS